MKTLPSHRFNGFAIVFFLLLIAGFMVKRSITLWNNRQWNYPGRFVVADTGQLVVTSYPGGVSGDIIEIKLPKDQYVEVPFDHGTYKLADVGELSQVEKKDNSLFLATVAETLGLPVNASLDRLTVADRLVIEMKIRDGAMKRKTIDLTNAPIYTEETRKDGAVIKKIDAGKVDYYLGDALWEKNIKDENLAIGIFNASGQPGIATVVSRKLEKIGIRVVEIGNWEKAVTTCELHATLASQKNATYERLIGLFHCTTITENDDGRFDISLVIGDPI